MPCRLLSLILVAGFFVCLGLTQATERAPQTVIFVHGLGSSSAVWREFPETLTGALSHEVRTAHFEYKTVKTSILCPWSFLPWCERIPTIEDIAGRLLTTLEVQYRDQPIVLVTHSLGSVVVADMMRQARERDSEALMRIEGIAFFAGPFRPNPVASVASRLPNAPQVVEDLGGDAVDRIVASWLSSTPPELPVVCVWGTQDDVVSRVDAHQPCSDGSRIGARQHTVAGDHNSLVGASRESHLDSVAVAVSLVERTLAFRQERCGFDIVKLEVVREHQWAKCRDASFGIASYGESKVVERWSGWRGGGYNQTAHCNDVAAGVRANDPDMPQSAVATVLHRDEEARWRGGIERRRQYRYFCRLRMDWNPTFNLGRGEVCGAEPTKYAYERVGRSCTGRARDGTSMVRLFNEATTTSDALAAVRLARDEFGHHVQATGPLNDSVASAVPFRLGDREFGALVYSYNSPANQAAHWLFLFDFYDPQSIPVDEMDADWSVVESASFSEIAAALRDTPGFNAPLEVLGAFGDRYRPILMYVQVAGRRDSATQAQLEQLRGRRSEASSQGRFRRVTISYDKLRAGGFQ